MIVAFLALALVAAGYVLGWSLRRTAAGVGLLVCAVLLVHALLPDDSAPVRAVGGSLRGWAAAVILFGLATAYGLGVAALRRRVGKVAPPAPAEAPSGPFRPEELDRYARHIMLREVGGAGQRKLKGARVLVIGAGGLGSPALLYLAASGVGTVGIIDDDMVAVSNLQRQIIHVTDRVGKLKVDSAGAALAALNPFVRVEPFAERLTEVRARELFPLFDLILDGSDNFATRYMANRVAVETERPLISAAITQWEGQIGLFDPVRGGPCYQCIFAEAPAPGLVPTCAEAGVIAPLPGVLGALMALEAVKVLTGAGASLRRALLLFDGLWGDSRRLETAARVDCPVCGGRGG